MKICSIILINEKIKPLIYTLNKYLVDIPCYMSILCDIQEVKYSATDDSGSSGLIFGYKYRYKRTVCQMHTMMHIGPKRGTQHINEQIPNINGR